MGTLCIDLRKFEVKQKQEISKDEAYIWVFGVLVDLNTISKGAYIIEKRCTDGNLGDAFKKGESRRISTNVGQIRKTVKPVNNQIAAGVVVAAWEHDAVSKDKQKAAYQEMCAILNDFVSERVSEVILRVLAGDAINEDNIKPSRSEMNALTVKISDAVEDAWRKGASGVEVAFKWAVGGYDEPIGTCQKFLAVDTTKNTSSDINFKFAPKGKSIDYRLSGSISFQA